MARMLFLTQFLPYPLDAGAKIRAYYVLRQLAQQHEITLVSFTHPDDQPEYVEALRPYCAAVHTLPARRAWLRSPRALAFNSANGQPLAVVRDRIGAMQQLLRRLMQAQRFAAIHTDQVSMAQYALYARQVSVNGRPRLLLDAHNALYPVPQHIAEYETNLVKRWSYQREARALARYEAKAYSLFDHVTFVSEEDRRAITTIMEPPHAAWLATHSTLIPVCIDPADRPLLPRAETPKSVLHLGAMLWPPTVEGVLWFTERVWPRVLEQAPQAHFTIVGKDAPATIEALPLRVRNVNVTGYVPRPEPYLQQAAAFLVPLHAGGGMRVRIIDAWSWGIPVISTTIGAEGIAIRNEENILIADSSEQFAQAIVRLLRDPALRGRLRQNGRAWVEEHYNWQRVYPAWEPIYEMLLHHDQA